MKRTPYDRDTEERLKLSGMSCGLFKQPRCNNRQKTEQSGPSFKSMLEDSRQLLGGLERVMSNAIDGAIPSTDFLNGLPTKTNMGMGA